MPHRSEKSAEAGVPGALPREGPIREESESSVSRGKARHRKSTQLELALGSPGEARADQRSGEAGRAAQGEERSGSPALARGRVYVTTDAGYLHALAP